MTTQVAPKEIDLRPILGAAVTERLTLPEGICILDNDQACDPEFGLFRILNPKTGDDRLTWDKRDFRAMQDARKTFIDLVKKGLKPFRVGGDGKRTDRP